jgi:hypothetical protein
VREDNAAQTGVLNLSADPAKFAQGSVIFRAVGYGHSAQLWKDVVKACMDIGYQDIMSIENEDPILPGEVGVERAAFVLKNVRAELLEGKWPLGGLRTSWRGLGKQLLLKLSKSFFDAGASLLGLRCALGFGIDSKP